MAGETAMPHGDRREKMFHTEVYRILSKKINLAVMLAGMLFALYYAMGNTVWGEGLIDDGRIYKKTEAIARDQEIAAEFSGVLTADTVQAIWEKYGPPVNYENRSTTWEGLQAAASDGGNDNFCNRFVVRVFGEPVMEDGEIVYRLRDGWRESRYLQGNYVFGYAGGSTWYWDRFCIAFALGQLAIIVCLCPLFVEDYACRTADVILSTPKGRFTVWKTRMAVGGLLASVYYWMCCGSIFFQYIAFYGADGLAVSCRLAGLPMDVKYDYISTGKCLLVLYLCGWGSTLVLVALVGAVSASGRQLFSVLVRSLLLYAGPLAVVKIVLDTLPMGRVNSMLHLVCYSMPLSYPGTFAEALARGKAVLTALMLTVAATATAAGAYRYCHHQVGQ